MFMRDIAYAILCGRFRLGTLGPGECTYRATGKKRTRRRNRWRKAK